MRLYFPYMSTYLAEPNMQEAVNLLGIRHTIEFLGRHRLYKTPEGLRGIPHLDYKVRLFPINDEYRKFSTWSARRINGVCWHGHYRFMDKLFTMVPDMSIRTTVEHYHGRAEFIDKAVDTYGVSWNSGRICKCD